MKRCFKCERVLPLADFYRHPAMADGHLGKCKDCTKRDVAERASRKRAEVQAYDRERSKRPERMAKVREYMRRRTIRHPEKKRAHTAVGNAIRDGRLTRQPCEVCGTTERVQAHHDDYSRPLDVRWLCFKHHREHHGQIVLSPY